MESKQKLAEKIKLMAEMRRKQKEKMNISIIEQKVDVFKQEFPIKASAKKKPFVVLGEQKKQTMEEIEAQIQSMVIQKKPNDDDELEKEEKKKELIMNTIKNRKKTKPIRPMDKATPFHELSLPYQEIKIFASYLPIYEERRKTLLSSSFVDLGVRNLQEVIFQCFIEDFIPKNFMKNIQERGVEKQIEFIKKFSENRLQDFDFNLVKFTPLDHRRLCGLLLRKNKKYTLGQRIYCVFKEITDFYEFIYGLEEDEYQKICRAVSLKFDLKWWEYIDKDSHTGTFDEVKDLDTSSVYQPRPSPMFGIDLDNPKLQIFQANKEKQQAMQRMKTDEFNDVSQKDDSSLYSQLSSENYSIDSILASSSMNAMKLRNRNKSETSQLNASSMNSSFELDRSSLLSQMSSMSNSSFPESLSENPNKVHRKKSRIKKQKMKSENKIKIDSSQSDFDNTQRYNLFRDDSNLSESFPRKLSESFPRKHK